MKKLAFIAADNQGCMYYRCYLPFTQLKGLLDTDLRITCSFSDPVLHWADGIVFQRQFADNLLKFIKPTQNIGKKVIYELDDNLWKVEKENPGYRYWDKTKLQGVQKLIKACSAVTTTTKPLAEILAGHNKNTFIIPNLVPREMFFQAPKDTRQITVGWAGSNSHVSDFTKELITAIKEVKKQYPFKLIMFGFMPKELEDVADSFHVFTKKPEEYFGVISSLNFDIGIIPCNVNYFNQCKSNIKFLEYSMTKTVSLASAVRPYLDTIEEGQTGFVYKNIKEFKDKLIFLLTNNSERAKVANRAYDYVNDCWTWNEKNKEKIATTYYKILD